MQQPSTRWLVLVLAAMVAAGLGYRAVTLEQREIDAGRVLAAASADARALQTALSDARRALAAMASPGQPAVSWSRQVGSAIEVARARLGNLVTVHGASSLGASAERFDRLVETERRLREYAVGGRSLQASDLAFGEALPHLDAVDADAAKAVEQLSAAAAQRVAAARQQQRLALAGALGALTLAALMLTPVTRPRHQEVAAVVASPEPDTSGLSLELSPVVTPEAVSNPAVPRHAVPGLSLSPIAAACVELARLSNGAGLNQVLAHVAPAIGARGIVVWLADADRRTLRAAASWGYDPRLVERFPVVAVDDDNPTARAFSTGAPSIAPGRSGEPAAVAAPIVGASGATGVFSVEFASSGGVSADVVAMTSIVAAQLATVLEPLPRPDAADDAANMSGRSAANHGSE